ncbi:MAG: hypothetical protein AABW41_04355 [Nanoarchaeota archaeon]|mgnify:FL=1
MKGLIKIFSSFFVVYFLNLALANAEETSLQVQRSVERVSLWGIVIALIIVVILIAWILSKKKSNKK